MARLNSKSKVLIIGGGVSGLALAQILRNHDIDFEIFERDGGTNTQGWSVGLDKCIPDLNELLPKDLQDVRESSPNIAIGRPDTISFLNGRTHDVLGIVGVEHKTNVARRDILRDILTKHLNVHFNKRFTAYEQDGQGVTVHFKDGSSASGTILVGADGSNSQVRRQLLDGFEATPSRALCLNGEVVLTKAEASPIFKMGSAGVFMGEPGLKGAFLLGNYLDNGDARFQWVAAWLSDNIETESAQLQAQSSEALHQKAMELTAHWPSYVVESIKKTGPDGMFNPPIRLKETVLLEDELPAGPVTLLGDSAHSMVPFRGMGANTALIATCDLARAIIRGVKGGEDIETVLRPYEREMIPRGREHVLLSREEAESTTSHDLSGGRLALEAEWSKQKSMSEGHAVKQQAV